MRRARLLILKPRLLYPWLSLVCLLSILLPLHGAMPPGQIQLGPPQVVATINPKMGVHTRLTDEVEPWKIKRTLELVREMGSPWIVEYFPWAYREPFPGFYDWSHSDLPTARAYASLRAWVLSRPGLALRIRPPLSYRQIMSRLLAITWLLLSIGTAIVSLRSLFGTSLTWPWNGAFSLSIRKGTPAYWRSPTGGPKRLILRW
jgi:hypothetical protein